MLLENGSLPQSAAHRSYIIDSEQNACIYILQLSREDRCAFIEETPSCREITYYIDYMSLIYCVIPKTFGDKLPYEMAAIAMLFLWMIFLAQILIINAWKNLCPSVLAIAKYLRMSEHLAGISVLAIANGLPDMMRTLRKNEKNTVAIYSATFGSALLSVSILTGLIIGYRSFQLIADYFLHDSLFLVLTVSWVSYIIADEVISWWDAVSLYVIFLVYIVCIGVEHYLSYRKFQRERHYLRRTITLSPRSRQGHDIVEIQASLANFHDRNRLNINLYRTAYDNLPIPIENAPGPNHKILQQFLHSLAPFTKTEWQLASTIKRVWLLCSVPASVCITLFIPKVNYADNGYGWSKLMNVVNCFLAPCIIMVSINAEDYYLYTGILWTAVAHTIFITSRTDRPPSYHWIFVVVAYVSSIALIYVVCSEFISVLSAFAFLAHLQQGTRLTIAVAWGICLGDIVTNLYLARYGYPRLAFTAAIITPFFDLTVVIGTTFMLKCIFDEGAKNRMGAMVPTTVIFLEFTMIGLIVMLALTRFSARKSVAAFTIGCYVLFVIFCLLIDFEIIHPHGTDHYEERASDDM